MTVAIDFRNVDIVFGKKRARAEDPKVAEALRMMDAGASRGDVASKTGLILGISNASLQVERGEICVLMGLSGSGKSTLLRAANGLNAVTRGNALVHHRDGMVDLATCDAATLRRVRTEAVAMVFQQFALLPWRTVRENVGLGLELRGMRSSERRRIVDEKLHLVGLEQWADRYAQELSGGMQQRVGLARAFATDADILLMDEPFSALDPLIRNKLQDELLALQAAVHKTILFVSHDLNEAMKLGNRIAILEGGRIIQDGTPEDIALRPANDYVASFVHHMNPLPVLKGRSVMTPLSALSRDRDALVFGPAGEFRLVLDQAGRALSASVGGETRPLLPPAEAPAPARPFDAFHLARADMALSDLIEVQQGSRYPVILADGERIVGVCSVREILQALTARPGAQATAAPVAAGGAEELRAVAHTA
ncbi:MAG TPA: choline ABC transporter ATP-binding protein [Acetobacteraceae bacterium]|nr:choline ABC transporter ATP-binding protein [Acetobacteraceae bacterium]